MCLSLSPLKRTRIFTSLDLVFGQKYLEKRKKAGFVPKFNDRFGKNSGPNFGVTNKQTQVLS